MQAGFSTQFATALLQRDPRRAADSRQSHACIRSKRSICRTQTVHSGVLELPRPLMAGGLIIWPQLDRMSLRRHLSTSMTSVIDHATRSGKYSRPALHRYRDRILKSTRIPETGRVTSCGPSSRNFFFSDSIGARIYHTKAEG